MPPLRTPRSPRTARLICGFDASAAGLMAPKRPTYRGSGGMRQSRDGAGGLWYRGRRGAGTMGIPGSRSEFRWQIRAGQWFYIFEKICVYIYIYMYIYILNIYILNIYIYIKYIYIYIKYIYIKYIYIYILNIYIY